MVKVNPIFESNAPESEENPTYVVSRLVDVDIEVEHEQPEEKAPSYFAVPPKEEDKGSRGGAGTTSDDSEAPEQLDSGTA